MIKSTIYSILGYDKILYFERRNLEGMKRKMVVGVLLAAVMGVTLPFAEAAFVPEGSVVVWAADSTTEVDGVKYYYSKSGSTCTITGCDERSGPLNIPSELDGYTVVKIGENAFQQKTAFTSLTIPDTVTYIDKYAFDGCTGLQGELVIPAGVTFIGEAAFRNCSSLTGNLVIPAAVNSIGVEAFRYCSGFDGNLTVTNANIGKAAFQDCTGFTGNLSINGRTIGADAFNGCSGFAGTLTLGDKVISIGESAFSECTGFIGDLVIPASVSTIGNYAFCECSGFSGTLTIGSKVSQIGERAFFRCTGFTGNLTIPESVTFIKESAFEGCSGFTGNLTINKGRIGIRAFYGCNGFKGNLSLADGVTKIESSAFDGCSGFTGDLDLPNSLTTIGDGGFADCSGMRGILTIPSSVSTIGYNGFNGTLFTKIRNGSSVTMPADWFKGDDGFITSDATGAEVTELPTGNYTRKSNVIVEFVTRMYNVALEREPDKDGLDQWSNDLKYGTKKGADIAEGFYLSQELIGKQLSNEEYVELAYRGIMNRGSDSDGKEYWVTALDAGCTYKAVVKGIVESTEFNNLCQSYRITPGTIELSEPRDKNIGVTRLINRMYSEVLGRRQEDSGLNYWCENILSNTTKENILDVSTNGFLHSQEFQNLGLNDTEYVKVLYRAYLGREAEQAGLDYWLARLSGGASRDEVAAGFAGSQEFANIMRSYGLDVQ